jgi:hypothetical protein
VLVLCLMGTLMMDALDNPFAAAERELALAPLGERAEAIIVEMHAEATSEKMAMGHFCDGRASLVVGTHTHVPTSDHQILPGGTAYITDAGMCGDYDSVIGMDKAEPLNRFLTKIQGGRFEPAHGRRDAVRHRGGDRRPHRACASRGADPAGRPARTGLARVLVRAGGWILRGRSDRLPMIRNPPSGA